MVKQPPVNLYQQCLPPLASMQELADQIGCWPHHADAERGMRPVERRYAVLRQRQLFVPAARHIRLCEGVDMLIRDGYEGRDPSGLEFTRRQAVLARRGNRSPILPPRPIGIEALAAGGVLIGAPGMGKSVTIGQALRRYPQVVHLPGLPTQVVWLKLECPSRGSLRSLCLQFFDELTRLAGTTDYAALSAERRASDEDLMGRMAMAAAFHGLGLLVVDEIQHIGRFTGEEHLLMTFLTQLTNQLGIPTLLMGTLSVLPQIRRTGRMARRSVGPACAVWMPRGRDSEWHALLDEVWRYQWTDVATPLSSELAAAFFECTGGILDLMIKLSISVQLRLIYRSELGAAGEEAITPAFVRNVADADFAPVKSMVKALCLGDTSKLMRFDDLHAFDRDYWSALEQIMDRPIKRGGQGSVAQANLPSVPEGDHYQLVIAKLQAEGFGADLVLQWVDQVRAAGHDAQTDPFGFYEQVKKLIRSSKRRTGETAVLDPATLEEHDLRRLVAEAASCGLTPLEAIKGAGLSGIWPDP